MTDEGAQTRETLASAAYRQLRKQIVAAELPPGSKLRIRTLCERFDVGLAPMREALSRLSTEKLVRQLDQKGFYVASLSLDELEDIIRARCWLNRLGLTESIARGGEQWEESLLLSYHRLSKIPRLAPDPSSRSSEWSNAHRAFHRALVSASGSNWLTSFCDLLFEAAERYRHFARKSLRDRPSVEDEHEAILKAALARDAERACMLLDRHFQKTAELVRVALPRLADGRPTKEARPGLRRRKTGN